MVPEFVRIHPAVVQAGRNTIVAKKLIFTISIAAAVGLILLVRPLADGQMGGLVQPSAVNTAALASLPKKDASSVDTSHLGDGLLPPTNSWMSGMVLQKNPQPVYPLPLSFLAHDNGFEIGLPKVTATASAMTAPHVPATVVQIPGAVSFKLTRYDKLSSTITYYGASGQGLTAVTVTEGSPFVFVRKISGDIHIQNLTGALVYTTHGSLVTFYPSANAAELKPYAGNELAAVDVSYSESHGQEVTSFLFHTSGGDTVFAPMPYQKASGGKKLSSTIDTLYGRMSLYAGTGFKTQTAVITPSNSLDLSHITSDQKSQLIAQLKTDAGSLKFDARDSYFGGKQLARAANLLDTAEQLQQSNLESQIMQELNAGFDAHLGPSYFYYDTRLHTVAADTAAFGSQNDNDHHFHYGYFLYAASILARYDDGFTKRHKADIDLLAADIGDPATSQYFVQQRTYDPYAGHSWADGLGVAADGNNQESSSEAVQAWNGLALWADETHNSALEGTAKAMLANEVAAAKALWRFGSAGQSAYTSPLVDINWGGKRVYDTFFSSDPVAKLAIQLIPLNPEMQSVLAADGSHIDSLVNAGASNFNAPLGDYALMYYGLRHTDQAISLAQLQTNIDDGNSRTYLLAWLFSAKARGL